MSTRRKRRRKKQKSFRLQLFSFILGIACSIPAISFADDLDDVLDDLITHRAQTKAAEARGETPKKSPKPSTASLERKHPSSPDSVNTTSKQLASKSQKTHSTK